MPVTIISRGVATAALLFISVQSAPAAEPRWLGPTKVEEHGRYTVRSFTARPGDVLKSSRGGALEVLEINDKAVVMKRTVRSAWIVGDYHFGNHEYLSISAIDVAAQTVTLRFRTKNQLYFWEALSH